MDTVEYLIDPEVSQEGINIVDGLDVPNIQAKPKVGN